MAQVRCRISIEAPRFGAGAFGPVGSDIGGARVPVAGRQTPGQFLSQKGLNQVVAGYEWYSRRRRS